MISSIYAAASGMVYNFKRQMTVANNLANVSTTGYKQDIPAPLGSTSTVVMDESGAVRDAGLAWDTNYAGLGTQLGNVRLDLSQGDLTETGNPLDLAISGPGFFAIQTPSGTLYTRDGSFQRDASGFLRRVDGGLLLGDDGPIQVGNGEIIIEGDGRVKADDVVAGRIRVVGFDPVGPLAKVGNNYLVPEDPNSQEKAAEGAAINQGFLERSNVDLTHASVEMVSAMRSYEASQKMIQLLDQTLDRAVNEIGKV